MRLCATGFVNSPLPTRSVSEAAQRHHPKASARPADENIASRSGAAAFKPARCRRSKTAATTAAAILLPFAFFPPAARASPEPSWRPPVRLHFFGVDRPSLSFRASMPAQVKGFIRFTHINETLRAWYKMGTKWVRN